MDSDLSDFEKQLKTLAENRHDDYEYARELLYYSSEKLQEIINKAVVIVEESEHPRAIEVATGATNALAKVAGDIMEHQIRTEQLRKSTQNDDVTKADTINLKFSTSQLLEMLTRDD